MTEFNLYRTGESERARRHYGPYMKISFRYHKTFRGFVLFHREYAGCHDHWLNRTLGMDGAADYESRVAIVAKQ